MLVNRLARSAIALALVLVSSAATRTQGPASTTFRQKGVLAFAFDPAKDEGYEVLGTIRFGFRSS